MSFAKSKGTKFESDIVKYLEQCGFTTARRVTLSGAAGDKGDIWLGNNPTCPDIIIECKHYAKDYSYGLIEDFVKEAHIEYCNATKQNVVHTYQALVICKRTNLGVADSWLIWKNNYSVTIRVRLGDVMEVFMQTLKENLNQVLTEEEDGRIKFLLDIIRS